MSEIDELVPTEVYSRLSLQEREEFEMVFLEMCSKDFRSFPINKLSSPNPGLRYLAMNDPLKYTLVTLESISEQELLELIEFDSKRLDAYHKLMWENEPEQGLWEQRFTTIMAALANPNLSEDSTVELLRNLGNSSPVELSPTDFLESVAYQLRDKWDLSKFNSSVLAGLVKIFELEGLSEELPRFKRLQRKAAKREKGR